MQAATSTNASPRASSGSASASSSVSSSVGATAEGATMRAVVYRRYGEPDVLGLEQVARPVPGDNDVLVRVYAAGVSVGDHHIVTGKPYLVRLSPFGGLPGPKHKVPGAAFSGVVEAVGVNVTTAKPGDEVIGQALNGAFAEYVAVPEGAIGPKPKNLTFEQAAAVPWGATGLQGLRDAGALVAGQKVLINGASGAVGTWAVQIAKALGAEVTAVCSTRNVEMVRSLGADEIIDYTKEDFLKGGARFDVMMDMTANRRLSECRSVLKPKGLYVACAGGGGDWLGPLASILEGLVTSIFTAKKYKMFVMTPKQKDLETLKDLVEARKAKPVIERIYPLEEVAEALKRVGEGHAQGQTVVRVMRDSR